MTLRTEPAFQRSVIAVVLAAARVAEAVATLDPAGGEAELAELESAVTAYLRSYRELLDHVAPRTGERRRWSSDYKSERPLVVPFVRATIGIADLIRIATVIARPAVGPAWGSHLLNAADTELATYRAIDLHHLGATAARALLPEVAADVVDTLRDVARLGGFWLDADVSRIGDQLDAACRRLSGAAIGVSLRLDTLTEAEASSRLGRTVRTLRAWRNHGRLLSVPGWDGVVRYPSFQVYGRDVHPLVAAVLPNVVPAFRPWPLALWLAEQVRDGRSVVETRAALEADGAWRPEYEGDDDGWHSTVPAPPHTTVSVPGPLYRVARSGREPFYFSSVGGPAHPAPADGGRWDLPAATRGGTLYLAERKSVAWAETLNRLPVVTLDDLLGRTMWTLTPIDPAAVDVLDLTDPALPPELWTELRRARTQAIAVRARALPVSGMRVLVRSSRDAADVAVVLFGPSGPTPPTEASLGAWRVDSSPSELDDALWEYLAARPRYRMLTSYLRRLPGELDLVR